MTWQAGHRPAVPRRDPRRGHQPHGRAGAGRGRASPARRPTSTACRSSKRDGDSSTLIFELLVQRPRAPRARDPRHPRHAGSAEGDPDARLRMRPAPRMMHAGRRRHGLVPARDGGRSAPPPATATIDAAALRTSQAAIGQRPRRLLELTDQDGRPLRLAALRGRPLVVSLVYTELLLRLLGTDAAPARRRRVGAAGARRRSVLGAHGRVRHGARHARQRMLAYGRDRGIDSADWHFASADAATIRRLADDVGFTWTVAPGGFSTSRRSRSWTRTARVVRAGVRPGIPAAGSWSSR